MNVLLIPPGKSLIEEILPNLVSDGRDYSANLVVFPGRRPSHFLRKALARELRGSFIPPVIFSMDEFVDHLYEQHRTESRIESIDAVSLLYEIHRKSLSPLGGAGFMSPDSFFPIGLTIFRDLEELFIEEVDHHLLRAVEHYTEETIPPQTLRRLQSLAFFYEEFYRTLGGRGFSTRSQRYRAAAGLVGTGGTGMFQKLICAGFVALTRSEKALFRKLLTFDHTLFLFQEGRGQLENLAELGLRPSGAQGNESVPEIHFYSSPDMHGQVYALRSLIGKKKDEDGFLTEQSVIVLPSSETLFPLLRHGVLPLSEDSYNISLGYPLQRTPLFAFLNNLMELIGSMDRDRLYLPDYLNFMLHPYTKNIYWNDHAEVTRILLHTVEDVLAESRTKTFVTLAEIEADRNLFQRAAGRMPEDLPGLTAELLLEHLRHIHHHTIEQFLSFRDVADFSSKCTELLTYISNRSTARFHPFFYPFAESFIRSLADISRSLMRNISFTERSSYFTFFRKYLMTCYSPFAGTPLKGLQVLGFLETRNLRFDTVCILDVNEEGLPDTKKADSLLPFRARQILGLPTYQDRDALAAHYFEVLIQGAREVHLFFIENDKKERSRFVEQLLWKKQRAEKRADPKHFIKTVQYRIGLKNKVPADIAKTDSTVGFLRDFSFSASALDAYLRCQLRFYYSSVLKLDVRETLSGEIDNADIGKFVHQVLADYFSGRKGRSLQATDLDIPELNFLIDRHFHRQYGEDAAGTRYLLKKQIREHLKDYFTKYLAPLIREEGMTVLSCEEDVHVTKNSFNLRGRIDTIIRRGDETMIVDYKTGSNPAFLKIDFEKLDIEDRASWNRAVGSTQLPFYLMLYRERTGASIRTVNGMFLLLGRSLISREIELPLFTNDDREQKQGLLERLIFRLLEEIINPDAAFTPAGDMKKTCPGCRYQYVCGTQWIIP